MIRTWSRECKEPFPHDRKHRDRPWWAYDEGGYCVACGVPKWMQHGPWCELAYLFDRLPEDDSLYRPPERTK